VNRPIRNYQAVCERVRADLKLSATPEQRMQIVVDALWDSLHDAGVSWVGFYIDQPHEPDDRRLVLGPCRNKPACSPIGLHGMCGKAFMTRRTCIVDDVRTLGPNYIACDPRDQSEIVVPIMDQSGRCWAVLDVDSWTIAGFDTTDEAGLRGVLATAGLHSAQAAHHAE
jgi:putative methionine-R-sulfoxide reductase with GAF domain